MDSLVVDNMFRVLDRKHRSLNRFLSEPLLPFSRHFYLCLYQFSMEPPMSERICKRKKTKVEARKSKLPIRSRISYFWFTKRTSSGYQYRRSKRKRGVCYLNAWLIQMNIQFFHSTSHLLLFVVAIFRQIPKNSYRPIYRSNRDTNQIFLVDSLRKMLIHYLEMKFPTKEKSTRENKQLVRSFA